jgi:hypothetical protein
VAKNTLAVIRDSSNSVGAAAPTLMVGVKTLLKLRLFGDLDDPTPYDPELLADVAGWSFELDDDFDQSTTKIVADNSNITLDTVEENDVTYTEITIPLPDMYTEELAAALGTEDAIALIGELVGYSSDDDAVFVLQLRGFTVRNRVSGLGTPTPIPTAAYSEHMSALIASGAQTIAEMAISSGAEQVVSRMISSGVQQLVDTAVSGGSYVDYSGARTAASDTILSGGYVDISGARVAAEAAVASGGYVKYAGARIAASDAILSGGYVDNSGARAAARDEIFSGGYVTSSGARQIALEVLGSAGSAGEGGTVVISGLDGDGAREIASAVIVSGGYVDVSGARAAASEVVASGGFVNASGARQIVLEELASNGGTGGGTSGGTVFSGGVMSGNVRLYDVSSGSNPGVAYWASSSIVSNSVQSGAKLSYIVQSRGVFLWLDSFPTITFVGEYFYAQGENIDWSAPSIDWSGVKATVTRSENGSFSGSYVNYDGTGDAIDEDVSDPSISAALDTIFKPDGLRFQSNADGSIDVWHEYFGSSVMSAKTWTEGHDGAFVFTKPDVNTSGEIEHWVMSGYVCPPGTSSVNVFRRTDLTVSDGAVVMNMSARLGHSVLQKTVEITPFGVLVDGREVELAMQYRVDSSATSVTIPMAEPGIYTIYQQPLSALTIADADTTVLHTAAYRFTFASGGTVAIPASLYVATNLTRLEAGSSYILTIHGDNAVLVDVASGGLQLN